MTRMISVRPGEAASITRRESATAPRAPRRLADSIDGARASGRLIGDGAVDRPAGGFRVCDHGDLLSGRDVRLRNHGRVGRLDHAQDRLRRPGPARRRTGVPPGAAAPPTTAGIQTTIP